MSLASLHEPEHLLSQIALQIGVAELSGPDELVALGEALGSSESLLVLDNLEQLIEAWPVVGALVASARGLRMLVTSREPLGVRGEIVYPVHPLQVGAPGSPGVSPAETLFLDCASRIGARIDVQGQEMAAVLQYLRPARRVAAGYRAGLDLDPVLALGHDGDAQQATRFV